MGKWRDFWDGRRSLTVLLYGVGTLLIGLVLLGCAATSERALSLLWALGGTGIGGLFGVLFGIPHVEQSKAEPAGYRQTVNGALEQISDWLTKMVVGIGLVELRNLPDFIHRCSLPLANALGSSPEADALALAVVVFFPIVGFLCLYLLTRLFLAQALAQAEAEANKKP